MLSGATMDERGVVALARAGDRAAQRRLFDAWQAPLYNYLRQMTRDDDAAADLTQETFVRAFRNLPRLRHEEAFRGWLYRIAHNLVRDRVAQPPVEPLDETNEPPDPRSAVELRLEQQELRDAVDGALATLPAAHREVVVLHHLQGLDVDAIAATLRVPSGTVKSRLARARETLRRKLTPFVEG